MVPRAYTDAFVAEHFRDVMCVDAVDGEADAAENRIVTRAEDANALYGSEFVEKERKQTSFVRDPIAPVPCLLPLERRREPDGAKKVRRAGFEPRGRVGGNEAFRRDTADHPATRDERGHFGQQGTLAIQQADARWAIEFMTGAREEVAIELRDVDRRMGGELRRVNADERIVFFRSLRERLDVGTVPQHVALARHGEQSNALVAENRFNIVLVQSSVFIDADPPHVDAAAFPQREPRRDVAVMIERCDRDGVVLAPAFPERMRDEIDPHRRTGGEHDFVGVRGSEELRADPAGALECFGRVIGQRMQTAMHAADAVHRRVLHGIDRRKRLLRRRGGIKVREFRSVGRKGEVPADGLSIEGHRGREYRVRATLPVRFIPSMNEIRTRILTRALLALLIVWGGVITLQYFAVPVHQSVMLDEGGKRLVETACSGWGFLCNGFFTLPASAIAFLKALGPFLVYGVLSLLVAAGFALRTYLRDEDWSIRATLSPFALLVLFVLSLWGLTMTLAFSQEDGMPMRRVIEPTAQVYPDASPQGLQDLRGNFEELQSRGCLTPRGTTVSGAGAFDYSLFCVQTGFVSRVLSQLAMLLLIAFNALVLGRAALHIFRLRGFPALPEGVISAGLGACLMVAILWSIAMLGVYTSTAGWALLIGIPVAGFIHSRYWLSLFWNERWELNAKPWSWSVILGWMLVTYLAFNFLNVVRPFPIGWDDLGRYLNQPRLLVSYGRFIPSLATFSWEYLTSLGFLLFGFDSIFGATLSMLINWSAGLLAVLSVLLFGRTYLGQGRGMLSALLYYALPMVGHFSFADMKVDNAIFAVGSLSAFAGFLAVCPPAELDDDEEHGRSVLPLLALAGVFSGFAFAMKPTAIMLIMAFGAVMAGVRLGWSGFLGAAFLAWALFTKQDVFKVGEVSGRVFGNPNALSTGIVFGVCAVIGLALLGYGLRNKLRMLRPLLSQIGVFALAFVVSILPWLIANNVQYGNWPPRIALTAPNRITTSFVIDDGVPPPNAVNVRTLPPELQIDSSHPACASTSKAEELDRYWGDYAGIGHYLGLPWRAVMNTDTFGYYVTLIPALLLLPLLLLVPFFWTREGRWMRWLLSATVFMVVQWCFFANGIVWYGLSMFLGIVVLLEALFAAAPNASTRRTVGVLLAISLLAAFSHRLWQFDTMRNIFEYPMGKVSAETMEERTIPHYDDIRDDILQRRAHMPDRPFTYRMGTFIPYFIPQNFEVLPLADNQLDVFNCLHQERDAAKTLARLQALGFNSMIFDMNTQTIEKDPNGSLHKKVQAFVDFANTSGLGIQIVVNDPGAGIAYILLP